MKGKNVKIFVAYRWQILSIFSLSLVLLIWWALTGLTGLVPTLYMPSPTEVINSALSLGPNLGYNALATLLRVVISWLIGSFIGISIGLLMIRSKWSYYILAPIIESLRPVPPVALIPLFLVWFGIGDTGKIILTALACFMVLIVNTVVSANNVPPVFLRAAKTLGASQGQIYRTVVLPAIVPELISGMRIAIALAFAITVAAEFMGAQFGIGYLIMQASRTLNTSVVILGVLVIAIEAFLLERLLAFVKTRLTQWTSSASD